MDKWLFYCYKKDLIFWGKTLPPRFTVVFPLSVEGTHVKEAVFIRNSDRALIRNINADVTRDTIDRQLEGTIFKDSY